MKLGSREEIYVNCKTPEERIAVRTLLHNEGYHWFSSASLLTHDAGAEDYTLVYTITHSGRYVTHTSTMRTDKYISTNDFLVSNRVNSSNNSFKSGNIVTGRLHPFQTVILITTILSGETFGGVVIKTSDRNRYIGELRNDWCVTTFELITEMEIGLKIKNSL